MVTTSLAYVRVKRIYFSSRFPIANVTSLARLKSPRDDDDDLIRRLSYHTLESRLNKQSRKSLGVDIDTKGKESPGNFRSIFHYDNDDGRKIVTRRFFLLRFKFFFSQPHSLGAFEGRWVSQSLRYSFVDAIKCVLSLWQTWAELRSTSWEWAKHLRYKHDGSQSVKSSHNGNQMDDGNWLNKVPSFSSCPFSTAHLIHIVLNRSCLFFRATKNEEDVFILSVLQTDVWHSNDSCDESLL